MHLDHIEKTSSTTAVSNVILITEPGKLEKFLANLFLFK
jgi:hypothetical protein